MTNEIDLSKDEATACFSIPSLDGKSALDFRFKGIALYVWKPTDRSDCAKIVLPRSSDRRGVAGFVPAAYAQDFADWLEAGIEHLREASRGPRLTVSESESSRELAAAANTIAKIGRLMSLFTRVRGELLEALEPEEVDDVE